MKSELFLEVSESLHEKTMRVFDTSHYCEDEVIENYLVEVLPPNINTWSVFKVKKNFSLTLNSSSLRYNRVKSIDELISLPDGIYEFKMSYKPNIRTISQFYHLRTVALRRDLQLQFNNLISEKCNIDKKDFVKSREELRNIDEYLSAAKWMVEECLDKKKGKELYTYTQELLKNYKNECKC